MMNEREKRELEASKHRLDNMGKYLCPKCGYHGAPRIREGKCWLAVFYVAIIIPIFFWLLAFFPEGDKVCAKCGAELSSEDHSAGMNYTAS